MSKRITIIALVISLLGLVAEFMVFMTFSQDLNEIVWSGRSWISTISLSYFDMGLLEYRNFDTGMTMSYLNVTAYSLLLIGVIIYIKSNYREIRLIRFIISILLGSTLLVIFSQLIGPVFYREYLPDTDLWWWTTWTFALARNIGVTYIAYYVLVNIRKTDNPETVAVAEVVASGDKYQSAPRRRRFANRLIDIFICIFIFSPFVRMMAFLRPIEEAYGERFAIIIFLVMAQLVYYCFFEIMFQATSGKMLTETRVINEKGIIPTADTILKRTLSRFIPFEAFSFFGEIFTAEKWHDSISHTTVVNEVKTGVNGGRYLLILPAIVVVGLSSWFIHSEYEDYQHYTYRKKEHNEKVENFRKHLGNLSTSHLIKIEDIKDAYSDDVYLKIEEIDGEEIIAVLISHKKKYSNSLVEIESIYNLYKDNNSLPIVIFDREDLELAYTPEYDDYTAYKRNTRRLLDDEREFQIIEIDQLFGPSIHDRGTGSIGSGGLSVELLNYGWPADIVSVEALEGNIDLGDDLPLKAPTVNGSDYPSFRLNLENYERGERYKLKMVLRDSLEHTQTYIIEGQNLEKKVQRIL